MKNCENCNIGIDGSFASGRFCSRSCSNTYSSKIRRAEVNKKVSATLKGRPTGRKLSSEQILTLRSAREAIAAQLQFDDMSLMLKKRKIISEQNGACNTCKLTTWMGKPITLEIEHKDGNNRNDKRENLEAICPLCHSYTKTWRGRNASRNNKISDDDFANAIIQGGSIYGGLGLLGMTAKGNNYIRAKRIIVERELKININGHTKGEDCIQAKLTNKMLEEARDKRKNGETLVSISKSFNVARSTLSNALSGKTYKK